ncbi:MAG: F0F1 ATP synthase subunit B [Mangrovibacterium sp.]
MGFVTPDYGTIFWMVIIFGIALLILKKFAWKPILNALKDRENSIASALSSAEQARREMENLKAGNEKILAEARKEKEGIISEAREVKDRMLAEAKKQAAREGQKLIESARRQINAEKEAAISEMKKQVVELSVLAAGKAIERELKDTAGQEELVNELLNEVKLQ